MIGAKVEIALREKGVAFDLEMVAFDRERGYQPKHPEVLRVNPKGQVPVLLDGGVELFDSTQIFEYLEDRWPEPPLWPRTPAERAQARRLEHSSDEVFFPHVIRLMGLRADPDPVNAPEWIAAREGIERYYAHIERLLTTRAYLAGDFGYADIAFYMAQFFAARHTVPMTDSHPQLLAWR
jgi:glutathione S-transferase